MIVRRYRLCAVVGLILSCQPCAFGYSGTNRNFGASVRDADVIAVIRPRQQAGQRVRAEVIRSLKGKVEGTVEFMVFATKDAQPPLLLNRGDLLVFLERSNEGLRPISAGDFACWPKTDEKQWNPWCPELVTDLSTVIRGAESLQKARSGSPEERVKELTRLLQSKSPFDQVIAIDYIADSYREQPELAQVIELIRPLADSKFRYTRVGARDLVDRLGPTTQPVTRKSSS